MLSQAADEVEDCRRKYASLSEEECSLQEELEVLLERKRKGEAGLAKLCDEMDAKIKTTQEDLRKSEAIQLELLEYMDFISSEKEVKQEQLQRQGERVPSLAESLEELDMQQLQLQVEIDDINGKMKKHKVLLHRYEEHKLELQARIEKGGEILLFYITSLYQT